MFGDYVPQLHEAHMGYTFKLDISVSLTNQFNERLHFCRK